MNKKHFIIAFVMVFGCTTMQAQTIDDFRKQFEEATALWKKQFRDFREKCNQEYADFIRQHWEEKGVEPPRVMPEDGKPIPPDFLPEKDRQLVLQDKLVPLFEIVPYKMPEPQPEPVEPIKEVPLPEIEEETTFTFTFRGTQATVRLGDKHRFRMNDCTEESVAKAWEHCSKVEFDNLLFDCLELRNKYQLCDWAYLDMLRTLGRSFFGKGTNEAVLLTSYIYCQSGYKMRMARGDSGRLYLLYASKHHIYGYTYFVIDNESYYTIDCEEESLHICKATFPKERPMSLLVGKAPRYDVGQTKERTLQSARYANVKATVQINKNLIDFYDSYPRSGSEIDDNFMTRWAIYANTPLAEDIKQSLYPALQQVIAGLSEKEAANRLLNFVQTGLTYEYDEKVWGDDRAFFAEESLYYPYADCEDRSVLFSRLVRDLLGLKVVLVHYPGHLATAVCFNDEVKGDFIQVNDQKFVVCDPTFIGGPVGWTMTSCRNQPTTVILLD